MSDAIAELAVGKPDIETPSGTAVVRITGNAVNIRVGDSTGYASVGQLSKGDVMEYVATAPTGWHAGDVYKRQLLRHLHGCTKWEHQH